VALLKDMSYEARMGHIRSSGVNSRGAVAVEWNDDGKKQRAEGHTADNQFEGLPGRDTARIRRWAKSTALNLTNQNSCEAVLVWRGHEGRKGWELGLELLDATVDFWGLGL